MPEISSIQDRSYASFAAGRFDVISQSKLTHIIHHAGHQILDIGCGPGVYIDALIKKGFKVSGIEGNPFLVEIARKTGADVFERDLENEGLSIFDSESYDTVIALDVLEHISNVEYVLNEMVRVAKKNVIISVPVETPKELSQIGLIHASYQDPTHLCYYTPKSLASTLSNAGLVDILIYPTFRIKPILTYLFPQKWSSFLNFVNRFLDHFMNQEASWTVMLAIGYKKIL